MPATIYGPITVETDGAEWTFGEPITGAELLAYCAQQARTVDPEALTASQARAFHTYFMEAIRGWDGLEDAQGQPVPFSEATAREIPMLLKVAAVIACLERRSELEGNASGPDTEPT